MRILFLVLLTNFLFSQTVLKPNRSSHWDSGSGGGTTTDYSIRWLANNRDIDIGSSPVTLSEHTSPELSATAQEGDSSFYGNTEGSYFYTSLSASSVVEDSGAIEFYLRIADRSLDNHMIRLIDGSEDNNIQVRFSTYELRFDVHLGGASGGSKATLSADNTWYRFRCYWKSDSTGVELNGVLVDSDPTTAALSPTGEFNNISIGDYYNAGDSRFWLDAVHIFSDPSASANLTNP